MILANARVALNANETATADVAKSLNMSPSQ